MQPQFRLRTRFKLGAWLAMVSMAAGILTPIRGSAASPAWWSDGNPPVLTGGAENNLGPATIGQAKWVVSEALRALEVEDVTAAATIRDRVTAPQPDPENPGQSLPAIVDLTVPDPKPEGWAEKQRAPLLIGQLKALSAPFYDVLHGLYPDWLNGQLSAAQTKDPSNSGNFYPWTSGSADDQNFAIATIGQLKAVFALHFDKILGFQIDSDGDGLPDVWELAHGTNSDVTDSSHLFQEGQLTNLQAYEAGVQAHPNANLGNFDGDDLNNDEDADPRDRLIDWSAGARPAFAVMELPPENVEGLLFDDLTESGTMLFTRVDNGAPVNRVVIDRNQRVQTFDYGASPSGFAGYSRALVGDMVPGFRLVGETSQECLWDPVAETFTPWQWSGTVSGYHDDIRDERNGGTVWWGPNWATLDLAYGLRTSIEGGLLPGEPQASSWDARIERGGNIVSEYSYWRWNAAEEEFDAPAVLPSWSRIRSATLVRADPTVHRWNLVAGTEGLMISKDGGPFANAAGTAGVAGVRGVTEHGWIWRVNDSTSTLWANGEWHALAGVAGVLGEDYSEVEILDMLDTGLAVAKIRKGTEARKLALLVPLELVAHKRGSLSVPGTVVPGKSGEYGYETVMMENADSESAEDAQDRDCDVAGNFSGHRISEDDDLVKVVLRWPAGLKIAGASLKLVHEGMQVDATKTTAAEAIAIEGPARLNFFDEDGVRLAAADLEIPDLANPAANVHLSKAVSEGEVTFFIEGADRFGDLPVNRIARLGGARLRWEFQKGDTVSSAKLLVYRGGFLRFLQPADAPGAVGTFEFRDGKGRVRHEWDGFGNEFKKDETDMGNIIVSWTAKSGKPNGRNYNVQGGMGHTPPGWYRQFNSEQFRGFSATQQDHPVTKGSSTVRQGAYVRWRQDDEEDPANRFTTAYRYNSSNAHDQAAGPPDPIRFKYDMVPITASDPQPADGLGDLAIAKIPESQGRNQIQIHPDGECSDTLMGGTAGCIGIQTFKECQEVDDTLTNYHGLKIKVQID